MNESTTDGRTTRRADRCALDGAIASSKRPSRVFLDDVAEELAREGGSGRMTGETLERVFFARLTRETREGDDEGEAYAWTVETYRRAQDEYRRRSGKTDGASVAVCEELGQCMEFCASYGGLLLNPALSGTFPQSARATARGACQLLDVMRGSSTALKDLYGNAIS